MQSLPILNEVEVRVLGVLMEKEKTTPDYYPMTLNSMVNACNQKSSRNPVVNYDETTVQNGVDGLKNHGLILTVTGGGSRTLKYKHNAAIVLDLDDREEAILCLLFLRGALTAGEINSMSGRLYSFGNLESVHDGILSLKNKPFPMVHQLEKQPGQKEARLVHLFSGEASIAVLSEETTIEDKPMPQTETSDLEARVTTLEEELAALKAKLSDLL